MNGRDIKFGSIFSASLKGYGSVQCGIRPVLIVQNNTGNRFAPTVTVIPVTTKQKANLPTHVDIVPTIENGLLEPSIAMAEQLQTISKNQLGDKLGCLSDDDMNRIAKAIKKQLPFKELRGVI